MNLNKTVNYMFEYWRCLFCLICIQSVNKMLFYKIIKNSVIPNSPENYYIIFFLLIFFKLLFLNSVTKWEKTISIEII